jgi:hypothetical protein
VTSLGPRGWPKQTFVVMSRLMGQIVYVVESFYERPRSEIATAARVLLALPSVTVVDRDRLLRALER